MSSETAGELDVIENVDLVVLSRDEGPLPDDVQHGISLQRNDAGLRVHRVIGRQTRQDRCRWESIAKARNCGKVLGDSAWLMFLDDDVVLPASCIMTLLNELKQQPVYGALAADYLGEAITGEIANHVAMGATLFRREALDRIQFRWEPSRCECQCCCDDLRQQMIGIAYSARCRAKHLRLAQTDVHGEHSSYLAHCGEPASGTDVEARILVAFDRRHFSRFRSQFVTSLRASGNEEQITVVGYGLYPSQRRTLGRLRQIEVLPFPSHADISPARRRLRDFQTAICGLHSGTPVAYWDAGDVIFQGRLSPLWELVRAHPDKLLTTSEVVRHPDNRLVAEWIRSIRDPRARRDADQLLAGKPILNGGFLATTVGTLINYLRAADELLGSVALAGTTDWGDQLALNLFCHKNNPGAWLEIQEGWNYCLAGRPPGEAYINSDGRCQNRKSAPIHVIHGNGNTLPALSGYQNVLETLARHRQTIG